MVDFEYIEEQAQQYFPSIVGSLTILFIILSCFGALGYILGVGVINDYVMVNVQIVGDTLESQGVLPSNINDKGEQLLSTFVTTFTIFDSVYVAIAILFAIGCVVASYKQKQTNYFSGFTFLFWGIMLMLFIISFFTTFSDWWHAEILLKLLPQLNNYLPMYTYIMNNIGLLSFILMIMCLIVNWVDFDLASLFQRKEKEKVSLDRDEVL